MVTKAKFAPMKNVTHGTLSSKLIPRGLALVATKHCTCTTAHKVQIAAMTFIHGTRALSATTTNDFLIRDGITVAIETHCGQKKPHIWRNFDCPTASPCSLRKRDCSGRLDFLGFHCCPTWQGPTWFHARHNSNLGGRAFCQVNNLHDFVNGLPRQKVQNVNTCLGGQKGMEQQIILDANLVAVLWWLVDGDHSCHELDHIVFAASQASHLWARTLQCS